YLWASGPVPLAVRLSDTRTWLANLVLLQRPLNRPDVWGVFWSLHYEVALYVVCSLLFACRLLDRVGAKTIVVFLLVYALAGAAWPGVTGKPPGNGDLRMVVLAALCGLLAQRYTTRRVGRGAFYGLLSGLFAVTLLVWSVNHALFPAVATLGQLGRAGVVMG